jgi:hypothetical protein
MIAVSHVMIAGLFFDGKKVLWKVCDGWRGKRRDLMRQLGVEWSAEMEAEIEVKKGNDEKNWTLIVDRAGKFKRVQSQLFSLTSSYPFNPYLPTESLFLPFLLIYLRKINRHRKSSIKRRKTALLRDIYTQSSGFIVSVYLLSLVPWETSEMFFRIVNVQPGTNSAR